MDVETEVEIDFSVWLSNNYEAAKNIYDSRRLTWAVLVQLLRHAHSAGTELGMRLTVQQLDKIEAERKKKR